MLGGRDTGASLASGCACVSRCLHGFANLFARQHLVMRNWPRWPEVFPREADLGRDTHGCSYITGSQKPLKVRVIFRAAQIQTPFRLNLLWPGLCRCYRRIKADVGTFATSEGFKMLWELSYTLLYPYHGTHGREISTLSPTSG